MLFNWAAGGVKINVKKEHLVCRSGAVKMSPDGSLIWSLIGFGKVKNMGLVVFYLPFSSYLWRLKSVK